MRSLAPALLGQRQKHVLILDDEPAVVHGLARALNQIAKEWVCQMATDPEDAWYRILHDGCDVLVTDIRMPKVDGLVLLERMQRDPKTEGIPVVIVTGLGDEALKLKALELGAVDLLTKPVDTHYLAARIHQALRWKEGRDVLAVLNNRLQNVMRRQKQEMASQLLTTLWRLIVLIEQRNPVLSRHSLRVAHYARHFGKCLGFSQDACEEIFWAGALHDVGKVVLPDTILDREIPLSPGEIALLEKHCLFGEQILKGRCMSPIDQTGRDDHPKGEWNVFDAASEVALNHHERWDGSGFPNRRARDEIPQTARLVTICDVFDHTLHKSLRTTSCCDVRERIIGDSGSRLDPQLSEIFIAHLETFCRLAEKLRLKMKGDIQNWMSYVNV